MQQVRLKSMVPIEDELMDPVVGYGYCTRLCYFSLDSLLCEADAYLDKLTLFLKHCQTTPSKTNTNILTLFITQPECEIVEPKHTCTHTAQNCTFCADRTWLRGSFANIKQIKQLRVRDTDQNQFLVTHAITSKHTANEIKAYASNFIPYCNHKTTTYLCPILELTLLVKRVHVRLH